ncbi:MAG: hypothetical protein BIFFINMI_01769 [Phycisphaerae bacterium]|nr:hypothetical protein [Phycisphaerae bacterium]
MRPRLFALAAGLALLAALLPAARADTIELKDGRTYTGTLLVETGATVLFEVQQPDGKTSMVRFPRDQVVSVVKGEVPPTVAQPPAPPPTPPATPATPATPPTPATPTRTPPPAAPTEQPPAPLPSDFETLQVLVAYREQTKLPDDRKGAWDDYAPVTDERDENAMRGAYGPKIGTVRGMRPGPGRDRARLSLAYEIFRDARARPVASVKRALLVQALGLTGSAPDDATSFQEELRSEFLRGLDMDNPRHLAGLFSWDEAAWQYSASASKDQLALRLRRLEDTAAKLIRWQIEYGRASEARYVAKSVHDACNSLAQATPDEIEQADLAAQGLAALAQRLGQLDGTLRNDPTDVEANKLTGLYMACYVRDFGAARRHFAVVPDATYKTLAAAGKATDVPQALFMLGEGLAQLADRPASDRPDEFADPMPLRRAAVWCYRGFLDSGKGQAADQTTAKLAIARLTAKLQADRPDTFKFFGIQDKAAGVKVVYIVSKSGSMPFNAGFAYVQQELVRSIGSLPADAKFLVAMFSDTTDEMSLDGNRGLFAGSAENKAAARKWIESRVAASMQGRTDPSKALDAAFNAAGGPPDVVFLLTDGLLPLATADQVKKLNAGGRTRVHTIAFREKAGEKMLKAIAQDNHGVFKFISEEDFGGNY